MEKKSKKIVADFANNPMPEQVQDKFRRWMSKNAEESEIEKQLCEEWDSTPLGGAENATYDRSFEQLMSRIQATGSATEACRRPLRSSAWRRIAATLLIGCSVLGLGVWGARLFLQPENGIYVVTDEDNKGRFVLPDGTQVWLNCDSKLYYPESFNDDRRTVRLEGEGLFNVTHDAARPFEVQTTLMNVEVLGTVFDLKSYNHLDYAEVVLVSGSVRATCGSQHPVTLSPNDRLVTYRNSKKLLYETVDANNYDKWMFDRQRLEQMPLEQIFVNLERRYNITFDIACDVNLTPRLTLSLRSEPLEEILDALSLVAPIRYQIEEDRVTITPK